MLHQNVPRIEVTTSISNIKICSSYSGWHFFPLFYVLYNDFFSFSFPERYTVFPFKPQVLSDTIVLYFFNITIFDKTKKLIHRFYPWPLPITIPGLIETDR